MLSSVYGAEYFQYDSKEHVCRLFSSANRECSGMTGPRGELVEECQIASSSTQPSTTPATSSTPSPSTPSSTPTPTPTPEEFLFLEPSQLLSLPNFSPYPCPGLEQFPAHLQCDQAGLVEDETGKTRLMVEGTSHGNTGDNGHKEWWFWRNDAWEKTANSSVYRFDTKQQQNFRRRGDTS